MVYERGGDCEPGRKVKVEKPCDGCFPAPHLGSPVVVKITRPINYGVNRGYGNRFPTNRGDHSQYCPNRANMNQLPQQYCPNRANVNQLPQLHYNQQYCTNKANVNQLPQVDYSQHRRTIYDIINRINDTGGTLPNYLGNSTTPPLKPPCRKTCDNCINILRDKELQLLRKEQEILKLKTHFTKLSKPGHNKCKTNCEQCFKALREKELELFMKEQEIANMKIAAAARSPIGAQSKVEKARCDNCFKALRQKELELLKKEHALLKNMTRPNINVKNLNYCSCCRDNKKSAVNRLKQQEEFRKKNRDNCFKQLRMKEIRLLAKEREIDKKIQKFREESIAKAKMDLENTPDPRLVSPPKEVIKCVCSCTGKTYTKEKRQVPPICRILPKVYDGFTRKTPKPLTLKQRRKGVCTHRCCVMKMATNVLSCFISPPNKKISKPKDLPQPCSFMKLLTWCSPNNAANKDAFSCCTMLSKPPKELTLKEEIFLDKKIKKQKALALKAAKAAAKKCQYRVDTIGQIRPRISPLKPGEKLDPVESEVLRNYGQQGLQAYKTKMGYLKIDAAVAQTRLPKRIGSDTQKAANQMTKKVIANPKNKFQDLQPATRVNVAHATSTFKAKFYDEVAKIAKCYRHPDLIASDTQNTEKQISMGALSPKIKSQDSQLATRVYAAHVTPTFKTKFYDKVAKVAKFKSAFGTPTVAKQISKTGVLSLKSKSLDSQLATSVDAACATPTFKTKFYEKVAKLAKCKSASDIQKAAKQMSKTRLLSPKRNSKDLHSATRMLSKEGKSRDSQSATRVCAAHATPTFITRFYDKVAKVANFRSASTLTPVSSIAEQLGMCKPKHTPRGSPCCLKTFINGCGLARPINCIVPQCIFGSQRIKEPDSGKHEAKERICRTKAAKGPKAAKSNKAPKPAKATKSTKAAKCEGDANLYLYRSDEEHKYGPSEGRRKIKARADTEGTVCKQYSRFEDRRRARTNAENIAGDQSKPLKEMGKITARADTSVSALAGYNQCRPVNMWGRKTARAVSRAEAKAENIAGDQYRRFEDRRRARTDTEDIVCDQNMPLKEQARRTARANAEDVVCDHDQYRRFEDRRKARAETKDVVCDQYKRFEDRKRVNVDTEDMVSGQNRSLQDIPRNRAKTDKEDTVSELSKTRGKKCICDYGRSLPERYRTDVPKCDCKPPRRVCSSGDFYDCGSSAKTKLPSGLFDKAPPCPRCLKVFAHAMVYCAGCIVGVPCCIFLCMCLLLSSLSD